ncbi:MAG: hypothetical protein EOO93_05455 [Pedobacter sp.]|nr:MAG: hypothetical protein EOO93_05455 [Pedobacter sp.]
MKTKILIILCVVVFASCKKKQEPTPAPELKTYIRKQTTANIGVYTWNYDGQNRLKEIVFVSANESSNKSHTYFVTAYDAQNRISEGKYDYNDPTAKDYRFKNTFNAAGKLERMQFYDDATGTADSYNITTYPNDQQTIYNSYFANGTLSYCDVHTSTSDMKNIADTKRYNGPNGTGSLLSTTTYRNINSTIKDYSPLYPVGYGSSPLRINVSAVQVYTPTTGAEQTFTFTYEANADGYVTKRISASGAINTYEYIKK